MNMIRPDGPADQAGLKPYDRILQVLVCFILYFFLKIKYKEFVSSSR